ncbi:50S ribosomal protein L3 [Candidatus Bathyarchaeota archaeon]|nr:MAG: 50S ribosomal protein L3 [Candidatus Bathyarchaeota archaeon]HDM89418.1 50S ribosomal protein L3 [Candidatus Bathyarchaeota archaeon]
MGHRKKHAPKRGSLAYLPRGRAARPIGRIRFWPEVEEGPVLLGFAGYKAGMTLAVMVEDKPRSPNFGKEVACPVTIIDAPPMFICAVRAYTRDENGLKTLTEAWAKSLPKDFERLKCIPKNPSTDEALKKMKDSLGEICEFRVIAAAQPRLASGVPKKKPDLMEIKVGGGTIEEQFEYVKNILGKTVRADEVFKEGQFVDVIAVSKGKGWQGVVKRWGVKILSHKSNKTKRGVASLGPWHPARVVYTVPRPGQMGYHQRTEFNKRILKIGEDGSEVTPKGGFLRYGEVKGMYIMLKGSVPGPAKRLIRLRYPARPPKEVSESPPEITYISLESPQGV